MEEKSDEAPEFPWPDGKRAAISLSFDDGRASQVDLGTPILDAHGVKGTFYVNMFRVRERLEKWKAAVKSGHEIGNHTKEHPCSGTFPWSKKKALEDYTIERMAAELDEENRDIQEALGVTPVTFAYPCNQQFVGRGEDVQSYVPLVARRFIVGRGGTGGQLNDPWYIDMAQANTCGMDSRPFEKIRPQIDAALDMGRWLILCGHDVGEPDIHQTTPEETLNDLCRHAMDPANGLWIDTVQAVGEYIIKRRAE